MSKRSSFERRPRDFYETPKEAVLPLLPHLYDGISFAEPCAGGAKLTHHIEGLVKDSMCFWASDIEPQSDEIVVLDALDLEEKHLEFCEAIITNPPFEWKLLKPMMERWIALRPTILLLPSDFMHNQRFAPFLSQCWKIVSIGRVKWIEGSKMTSTENFAWYFFNNNNKQQTQFYGRQIEQTK